MTDVESQRGEHHIARSNVLEPAAWYSEMRAKCPVHKDDGFDPPFFVLTKYADIDRAIRDQDLWVNRDGPGLAFAAQGVLQSADGDDHRRHRSAVTPAFTTPAMRRVEPRIRKILTDLFDSFQASGQGDWIRLLAKPFPVRVIAEILAVPADQRDEFVAATGEIVAAFGDGDAARYQAASTELRRHMSDVIHARLDEYDRKSAEGDVPDDFGDDVPGLLVMAHRRGELSFEEMVGIETNLLIGGNDTTTNLIALMVYRLASRPDLLEQIRADRSLVSAAVEETLRFDAPTQGMFRTNTSDAVIGDVTIPAGSKVELLFASANRDEDAWTDPETFRIDRDPRELRRHMAFGRGMHLCIGAPLARMEAAMALNELLDRFATVDLDGDPVLSPSFILRGFSEMPIRWTLA